MFVPFAVSGVEAAAADHPSNGCNSRHTVRINCTEDLLKIFSKKKSCTPFTVAVMSNGITVTVCKSET